MALCALNVGARLGTSERMTAHHPCRYSNSKRSTFSGGAHLACSPAQEVNDVEWGTPAADAAGVDQGPWNLAVEASFYTLGSMG